jgi:hypothetical protein
MHHRLWAAASCAALLGVVFAVSCGSDADNVRAREPEGGAGGVTGNGAAGEVGQPKGGTHSEGGTESSSAGTAQAGTTAQAGAPNDGLGGAAGASMGGIAGVEMGGAAGAEAGAGGAGGASDPGPVVTVDPDCLPPPAGKRLSPAAAGLPSDGLALWLRADRGVYATEQHRVCAWVDESGNDQVFYANGQNRALWTEAGLGARPAIDFDAAGRYVSTGGVLGIPATAGRTFIAVVQLVNTTGRFTALMQGVGNTPGTYVNLDTNTFQTAGSREGVYVTNNSYDTTLATSTSPRVHVFTVSSMVPTTPVLSTIDYRVNGATQTLSRNAGGLGNGNVEDFSGANFTLVGSGTRAFVAEAIVYGRALTVVERASVETALAARYGIP